MLNLKGKYARHSNYFTPSFNNFIPYFLFILLISFCSYEYVIRVMLSAITPILITDLHFTPQAFGILSSVYFYAYAPVQLFSGYIHQRYGVVHVTTLALFICILSTYLFSYSHNYQIFILCRFMMGFASGFAFVGAYILVSKFFPYKRWGLMYGLIQFLSAMSAMIGQNILAQLAKTEPWRQLVFKLALIGTILFAIFMFFWKRHETQALPNSSNSLYESVIALCKNKQTLLIALYSLFTWGPITIYTTLWGPLFLSTNYGWSNAYSVSVASISWIGVALGSPVFGWLTHILGSRRGPLLLATLIGLFSSPILIFAHINNHYIQYLLAFCIGLATSGQPVAFIAIQESTDNKHAGTAIGLNNFAVIIGGAIFQALSSLFLTRMPHATNNFTEYSIISLDHLQHSLLLIIMCYLISTIIVIFYLRESEWFANHNKRLFTMNDETV